MNDRIPNTVVRAVLIVLCLTLITAGFVSCDFDELEYYDPETETTEPAVTSQADTGPDYESVLIGSTYSALLLMAMI